MAKVQFWITSPLGSLKALESALSAAMVAANLHW
jgi:hypothetical protein